MQATQDAGAPAQDPTSSTTTPAQPTTASASADGGTQMNPDDFREVAIYGAPSPPPRRK